MASLQLPVTERVEHLRTTHRLARQRSRARRWRPLPHEIGFGALYTFVIARLLLASGRIVWVEVGIWASFAAASVLLIALTRRSDSVWAWRTRLGAYVVLMNAAYFRMGAVVTAVGGERRDALLQEIDTVLFGHPLPLSFDVSHSVVSELLSLCYFLLFPYILVSCGRQLARFRRAPDEAIAFYSGFFVVYALGFLGYLVVPARGPWLDMPASFTHPIAGGWLTALNQSVVAQGSNRVDVFPSLHVAASAFMLFFDRRFAPWRYRIYFPAAVGLWISTVYLRFHYGVDVIAGALVAAIALRLAFDMARRPTVLPGARCR